MSDHVLSIVFSKLLLLVFLQTWGLLVAASALIAIGSILFLRRISILKNQKADLQRQVHEKSELLQYSMEKEKKAKEIASQANHNKSLLLVRINHEIRTPLNGVLGMTSLLAETVLSSEQQEYSDTIRESGEALLKVV